MSKHWPTWPEIQTAVKRAMVNLFWACDLFEGDARALPLMTRYLIFILHYNGLAGRREEWEILLAKHVREQIDAGENVLICQKHKTAETYGDVGKHLFEGTVYAMDIYDKAFKHRPRTGDLFFQPVKGKSININDHLEKGGKEFFPTLKDQPTSQLIRKQFHTRVNNLICM